MDTACLHMGEPVHPRRATSQDASAPARSAPVSACVRACLCAGCRAGAWRQIAPARPRSASSSVSREVCSQSRSTRANCSGAASAPLRVRGARPRSGPRALAEEHLQRRQRQLRRDSRPGYGGRGARLQGPGRAETDPHHRPMAQLHRQHQSRQPSPLARCPWTFTVSADTARWLFADSVRTRRQSASPGEVNGAGTCADCSGRILVWPSCAATVRPG